jgi:hypothetical protein
MARYNGTLYHVTFLTMPEAEGRRAAHKKHSYTGRDFVIRREIRKGAKKVLLWMGILFVLIASSIMPAFAVSETITYDYYD